MEDGGEKEQTRLATGVPFDQNLPPNVMSTSIPLPEVAQVAARLSIKDPAETHTDSIPAWISTRVSKWTQNALLRVLRAGPIPQHVAFVMDGNRRYARMHQREVHEGHSQGFVSLRRMLEVCLRLDVKCVSAYAFAIDNFKRSPSEVEALMKLAEEKLLELSQHGDLLQEYGVRLNIVGRRQALPPAVQQAAQQAEELTRHNDRAILNLCMPYASTDEMTHAICKTMEKAVQEGKDGEEICEADIEANLMTTLGGSPPLDILVRTSGVQRLSDFLLWQCCEDTQLYFSPTYWPDFGFWDFLPILLQYQQKMLHAPPR